MLHGEKLNVINIISITRKLIELVNVYKTHGLEKKALVTSVLKRFIETHMKDDPDVEFVLTYVVSFLPSIIDTIAGIIKKGKSGCKFMCFTC